MNIVFLCIGIVIGVFAGIVIFKPRISGVLRVETSDPTEQPYIFLELSEMPISIKNKKYVTFEVNPNNYISQK